MGFLFYYDLCDSPHGFPVSFQLNSTFRGRRPPPGVNRDTLSAWCGEGGRIWLSASASDLQLRICIVGNFGVAGHRSIEVTLAIIRENFVLSTLLKDVKLFVNRCLHGASVVGGPPAPRPFGEAIHGEKPNEVSFGITCTWAKLLAKKCMCSSSKTMHLTLFVSSHVRMLMQRPHMLHSSTGSQVSGWVSDQGTHFKNRVIEALKHLLGAHHHFTTARCPWSNGTIEVVTREVLRCARSLLSEWSLATTEWTLVIKIIQ
ncbi:Retrotransposon protein [Phytophthora megakarya]|uniref:Retrotransposon protein n=1 Tax=Phytophthora megakarya TaxID=4795 RepID=A0A225X447_9STRA|nr:Retrotransposon protein [Phytophthora megakarya]